MFRFKLRVVDALAALHLTDCVTRLVTKRIRDSRVNVVTRSLKTSEPDERVVLFNEPASYFQKMLPFTKEVSDTTSDKQYIKSIVDVMHGVKKNDTIHQLTHVQYTIFYIA